MILLLRPVMALLALGSAALAHEVPKAPAAPPDFTPPAAGSYALPPIQPTPAGTVLDSRGRRHDLKAFTTGKVTLLSLFYAQCADPEGCPAAFNAMIDLRDRLAARPDLARRVRLVSLSFDPRDTPELLAAFGHHLAGTNLPWSFLAAASSEGLAAMLDGFGQDIAVEEEGDATQPRVISHMLKLFLIDRRGQVREIYTTAFLQPEVMYNDILTLLIEDGLAQR
ncbi:MAG: SCO family protein [Rhodospirillales bacterium]|nr:SCO family protein [Rhodospirillales bacterium]